MNLKSFNFPIIFFCLCSALFSQKAWPDSKGFSEESVSFMNDPALRRQVDFWVRIYSQFNSTQGVLHDSMDVGIIYEVIELQGLTRTQARSRILNAKRKWIGILKSVAGKWSTPEKFKTEEREIYQKFLESSVFRKKDRELFITTAKLYRIRFQKGLKDQFRAALSRSDRYIPMMERVFKKHGVPLELTRIPFVESGFRVDAKSKVGAAGPWQFMRSTADQYISVNHLVDERVDPLRSTEAAAKFLKKNFLALKKWSLAITAYNHGLGGMKLAIREVESNNLKDILSQYWSRSFRFASRNFYVELLAAVEVEKNRERYFRGLKKGSPLDYVEVAIADYIFLPDLLKGIGLSKEKFWEFNPGFLAPIRQGKYRLPALSRIKLPQSWGKELGGPRKAFSTSYNQIPKVQKYRTQVKN